MIQLVSIICIAVLVFADQLIKWIVENHLMPIGRSDFIPKIVEFYYTENTGAAFSMFENHTEILSILTIVFIVAGFCILMSGKIKNKILISTFILILSGGLGNLIDRIFRGEQLFHGYVIDYIKVLFVDFAIFNFADCLVCIGSFMIFVYIIVDWYKESSVKKKGKENGRRFHFQRAGRRSRRENR